MNGMLGMHENPEDIRIIDVTKTKIIMPEEVSDEEIEESRIKTLNQLTQLIGEDSNV